MSRVLASNAQFNWKRYMVNYIQTCLRGHPREGQNVAIKERWPLNTGSFALYFGSRDPEKAAA